MKTIDEFGGSLSEITSICEKRDVYIDDSITSLKDIDIAIVIDSELSNLFRKFGVRLRRWISNSHDVLEKLPKPKISDKVVSLTREPLPVGRTPGVCWDTEQDTLRFQNQLDNRPDTKRGVLVSVATVLDPLELLSPFTLVAKILLQDICRKVNGWDEELSADDKIRWHS